MSTNRSERVALFKLVLLGINRLSSRHSLIIWMGDRFKGSEGEAVVCSSRSDVKGINCNASLWLVLFTFANNL